MSEDWRAWREARRNRLLGPFSPLALTGTHWFEDSLVLDGVAGRWLATGRTARLTANGEDDVTVDGVPLDGTAEVASDADGPPSDVRVGSLRLRLIDRDGVLAVRVFDPAAPTASGFEGVSAFEFDPSWVLPARFEPFDAPRQVVVPNADGVDRPLPLGGTVSFARAGVDVALQVEVDEESGELQAVFSDATSGVSTYRFRFVNFPTPDADGATVADLNRAFLPPCAFSDFYVCPFPPPGNALRIEIAAGEQAALGQG